MRPTSGRVTVNSSMPPDVVQVTGTLPLHCLDPPEAYCPLPADHRDGLAAVDRRYVGGLPFLPPAAVVRGVHLPERPGGSR